MLRCVTRRKMTTLIEEYPTLVYSILLLVTDFCKTCTGCLRMADADGGRGLRTRMADALADADGGRGWRTRMTDADGGCEWRMRMGKHRQKSADGKKYLENKFIEEMYLFFWNLTQKQYLKLFIL